jgi:DnaJ-class molecular chaperone
MNHSEMCPVCKGISKVRANTTHTLIELETCHGCNGKGWITVEDSATLPFYSGYFPYPGMTTVWWDWI